VDIFQRCYEFNRADEVKAANLYPYFHPIEENEGPVVHIGGKRMVMAGSNNYLGLTAHPKVKEAAEKAIKRYGTGCSGSRYLTGTLDLHIELEKRLAKFLGYEDVLVFSTGFQTSIGVISTLVQKGDYSILDREDHACIFSGALLAKGQFADYVRYKHSDMEDLDKEKILVHFLYYYNWKFPAAGQIGGSEIYKMEYTFFGNVHACVCDNTYNNRRRLADEP